MNPTIGDLFYLEILFRYEKITLFFLTFGGSLRFFIDFSNERSPGNGEANRSCGKGGCNVALQCEGNNSQFETGIEKTAPSVKNSMMTT